MEEKIFIEEVNDNDYDDTYPEYDGMESDDNYVTALKFKYNSFK